METQTTLSVMQTVTMLCSVVSVKGVEAAYSICNLATQMNVLSLIHASMMQVLVSQKRHQYVHQCAVMGI
jgi:hypothetical protein